MTTSQPVPPNAIKVFFSYAHVDEVLRNELANHLSLLERQGIIAGWHDRRIVAGTQWADQIDTHLQTAHIILLLVSSNFLASNYCYDVEVQQAMARHEAGEARVIPIILRPVYWQNASFGKLQALPRDGRAVTTWSNQDEAFLDIVGGICRVVEELAQNPSPPEVTRPMGRGQSIPRIAQSIQHPTELPEVEHLDNLDLKRPITIRRFRKQEKIDAKVIANVAFHPNGQQLAFSLDNRLFLLPLNDVFPTRLGIHVRSRRVFSRPDNLGDSGASLPTESAPSDSMQQEFTNSHENQAHIYHITDISFSPDGKLIASSDSEGYIKFWSLATRKCVAELSEHNDAVTRIAFSPYGELFASAGYDEFIYVWKVDDILSQHSTPITTFEKKSKIKKVARYQHDIEQIISMTFSHNGEHLASGDQQGVVVVREINSSDEVSRRKIHTSMVSDMAFSPTNHALLATASWDTRIRLTDFFVSNTITLGVGNDKHTDSVVSIAFAPRGDVLVSSGADKHVKLWDVENRRLLLTYASEDDRPVEKVAFFPNQYDFATDSYSSDISLWDITNEGDVTNTRIDLGP